QLVKGGFVVSVSYSNADKMISQHYGDSSGDTTAVVGPTYILLEEIPSGGDAQPIILDSVLLKGKEGKIELHGNGKEEGIYQLVVQKGPVVLLINDVTKINIALDLSKQDNYYTVSGSEASDHLKSFINKYDEKASAINHVFAEIDSLKQFGGSDSLLIAATYRKNKAITSLNEYVADFIDKADSPAESIFALGMGSRSFQSDEFGKLLNTVVKRFPEHRSLAKLKTTYDMQQAQMNSRRQAANIWTGKMVPDLALPSVEGKVIPISSFRGKYLLVDFWASWCGPCRAENPNVVNAWKKFKDKNFTILGVSLDREGEKDKWIKAIHDDQLTWQHVSDLRYWNSSAVDSFKIESIPFNILVDPNGKIIAEGLRGAALEDKLTEVLQ
ncbi:MAG TPA: TlpA disulfide reductase family protein, partial [Chitinophagaceae bacterium]|nr:TlpA disulfide reductase family protein [Chitinophagaceae bacterium]